MGRRGPEGQRARPAASGASSEDTVAESFLKLMKVTTPGIQGNPKVCTYAQNWNCSTQKSKRIPFRWPKRITCHFVVKEVNDEGGFLPSNP